MRRVETFFLEPCHDREDKYIHPTRPETSLRLAEALLLLGKEGWWYGGELLCPHSGMKRQFFQREMPDASPYRG
jgi:hypothetical protein